MRLLSKSLQHSVRKCLLAYQANEHALPGISTTDRFDSFLRQLFDSIRRVEYVIVLSKRDICLERSAPNSEQFDPLRAAILQSRAKNLDEACWLVFLATHFGKHIRDGWALLRSVYGDGKNGTRWDWRTINSDPSRFVEWLSTNHRSLSGRFGNHRKYLSLNPQAPAGTADAFVSYVEWIRPYGGHAQMLTQFRVQGTSDAGALFRRLYGAMAAVRSFGRMGRFDYLTMLGKLALFPIEPDSAYIHGSTGPRKGAALLLNGSHSAKARVDILEKEVQRLGGQLASVGVNFSMQVLEDALCNWQKSPDLYVRFRG